MAKASPKAPASSPFARFLPARLEIKVSEKTVTAKYSKGENLSAKRAIAKGKNFRLEHMNAYERRIIHDELTKIESITTQSYGMEPNRYIVIKPKGGAREEY